MSDRSKNEICLNLWQFYKGQKAKKLDLEPLKADFRHEILRGYRVEADKALDDAAANRFVLDATESLILKKHGFLITKKRLTFKDSASPDAMLRSMVGSMVIDMKMSEDGSKIMLLKTDGENEYYLTAENPAPDYKTGLVVWVAEPFTRETEGNPGKAWSQMSKEEREQAAKDSLIQGASSMPKYLQKRRAKIASVTVAGDDVNAWLMYRIEEEAPFNREDFENDAILEELGISKEEASEEAKTEETESTAPVADTEKGVNASAISDEHFTALDEAMEIQPPDNEANPAEESDPAEEF